MNKEPLISVIVTCYNSSEFIKECLDSVFAQTFTDFELIVVDDGSKDNTSQNIIEYFGLEEIEKVVSIIHIFDDNSNKKLLKDKDPHHALIAVVIALMTVAKINLLEGMQTNSVTADDVVDEMGFDSLPHDAKKSHLKKFLLTIFSIYLSRNTNDIINIINTAVEEEPNHYVNYLHLNDFLAWTIQVGLILQ